MSVESVLAVLRAVYDGDDSKPAIASRSLNRSTQTTIERLKSKLNQEQLDDIRANFRRCTRLGRPRPRVTTPEEVFEPDNPLTLAEWEKRKEKWRDDRCAAIAAIEKRCKMERKQALGIGSSQLPAPAGASTAMVVFAGVPEPPGGPAAHPAAAAAVTPVPARHHQVSPAVPVSPLPMSFTPEASAEVETAQQLLGLQQGSGGRHISGYSVDAWEREQELRALPSELWQSAARAPNAVTGEPDTRSKNMTLSNMMAYEKNWASPWLFGAAGEEGSGVRMIALNEGMVMPVFFMNQRWLTVRRAGASYARDKGHGLFADKPFFGQEDIIPYFGVYDAPVNTVNGAYLLGTYGKQLTDGRGTVAGYINSVSYGRKRDRDSDAPKLEPNATISKVAIELVKGTKKRAFMIRALRPIERGDEILLSYAHFPKPCAQGEGRDAS